MKNTRRAVGLTRRRSLQVTQRDAGLLPRIQQRKAEPPFWGYRRSWTYLRLIEPLPVNKQRVWRPPREHQLLGQPKLRLKAKWMPTGSQPRPTTPQAWWGLDITKVVVQGYGWVDIGVVLEWYIKLSVGDAAGIPWKAQAWLAALDMAVNGQFPEGVRGQGLALLSDQGYQPTSMALMRACGSRTGSVPVS